MRDNASTAARELRMSTEEALVNSIVTRFQKQGNMMSSDGASSYAEPTLGSIKKVVACLKELGVGKSDVIMDLGHGVGTTVYLLCHYFHCKGVGVEYSDARHMGSCHATVQILEEHSENHHLNANVALFHGSILELTRLPDRVTVVWMYDEVFNPELMDHILDLLLCHPNNVKYLCTVKALRDRTIRDKLSSAGFDRCEEIGLVKHGSHEASKLAIFKREKISKPSIRKRKIDSKLTIEVERGARHYWTLERREKYAAKNQELQRFLSKEREPRVTRRRNA